MKKNNLKTNATAKAEPKATPLATANNLTEQLKAKATACADGKAYLPFDKKQWDATGSAIAFVDYKLKVEDYQKALFKAFNGGTGTGLDISFKAILSMLGIPTAEQQAIVKTLGNHKALLPKAHRRELTEEGKAIMKKFADEVEKIEQNKRLSDTVKASKIEEIQVERARVRREEPIYTTTMYSQVNANAFRKQVEQYIAYQLIGLKTHKDFVTSAEQTATKSWQRLQRRASKSGLKKSIIQSYVAKADKDGLKSAIEEHEKSKVSTVEAKAKAQVKTA
ncbi:hypothetical protein M2140_000110 [Clostridiales Family XIII bacterium PM5-7]